MIRRVGVVIPARDEAERIDACLDAVRLAAAEMPGVIVQIIVVADGCVDDTAARASRYPEATVLETEGSNVGGARRHGAAFAIMHGCQWIANTDADSLVPFDWLRVQLELANLGADAVVGTVRPNFHELTEAQQEAWTRSHDRGQAIGHVHGANLGIRSTAYIRSGGFTAMPEHEDADLVDRLRRHYPVVATSRGEVTTSGRPVGRTAGGYARYLREDLLRLPSGSTVEV
ncbi:MAG: glycosyltransferase family 2 protein [Actinomycetota bacterium]|nr:glycosyltransferase family 2 protein [Actinomycetota bacterium]